MHRARRPYVLACQRPGVHACPLAVSTTAAHQVVLWGADGGQLLEAPRPVVCQLLVEQGHRRPQGTHVCLQSLHTLTMVTRRSYSV